MDAIARGDAICTDAGARLGGTFVAWISTPDHSALEQLAGNRGWVRPDGLTVADGVADLVTYGPLYPLDVDENGTVIGWALVATGTRSNGAAFTGGMCEPPKTIEVPSLIETGQSDAAAPLWTETGSQSCNSALHLYCFETDHSTPQHPPAAQAPIAFVSVGKLTGVGGLAAADAVCANEAAAAGLDGTFVALLATSTATARSRVGSGPWSRIDGVVVSQDLVTFEAPIDLTATGSLTAETRVWTGAATADATSTRTCGDWQQGAAGGYANLGSPLMTSAVFADYLDACGQPHPVYCAQVL